jgi:hypothetical protein
LAIALVPNTSAPWVMIGVRVSSGDCGATTNCGTGSAAFGSIAFATGAAL